MQKANVFLGLAVLSALIFSACPADSGTETATGGEPNQTADENAVRKENLKGRRVINEIWGEPQVDPRNAMGYELATSGKPFFDRYIVLYGGRIINNDCVNNPRGNAVNCSKTGLHLHFDDDVYDNLWLRHTEVLKPLQDKGIKVLMGLVPKDGGACIGAMYEWPMEPVWPWAENNNGEPYPYQEGAVNVLIGQIVEALNTFQIDGVGYDEEYGNSASHSGQPGLGSVYPAYSGQYSYTWTASYTQNQAWKKGGQNLFRFAYNLQKAKPGIIQDVYEIRYGANIPGQMVFEEDGKSVTVKNTDVFGISYEPTYGGWVANSAIGMPKEFYGPMSIDIASGIQPNALPPWGRNNLEARMRDHLNGNYGVNMFYCLRDHDTMARRYKSYYGTEGRKCEEYLSVISRTLFGEETVYKGEVYPQFWD